MSAPLRLRSRETGERWVLDVLFEDPHLLVVDKPAGLLASRDPQQPDHPSVLQLLRETVAAGTGWAVERGLSYLVCAHRVEPGATGVLVLARSRPALMHVAHQFGSGQTAEVFVALVQGSPVGDAFRVAAPLIPHPRRPGLAVVGLGRGRAATTECRVLERFDGFTLLECRPSTRRPDQIGAHLRSLQLLLVGDQARGGRPLLLSKLKPDYRFKKDRDELPLVGHPALHLAGVELTHPVSGERLQLRSPLPKELAVGLKFLRRYRPARGATPPPDPTPEEPSETEPLGSS